MPLFQFRVTEESSEKLQQVSLWLRSSSTVIIIAQEVGSETEKQHIHAVLDVAVKSTFVQQFHRHFTHMDASGNKVKTYCGNEKYSCEALKKPLENNLRYLCKGEKKGEHPNILYSKYDAQQIIDFHNQYWDEFSSCKKEINKEKKSTLMWSQQVKKDFEIEHPQVVSLIKVLTAECNKSDKQQDALAEAKFILFDFCMQRLGAAVKVLDENVIKKLYNGIVNAYIQSDISSRTKFNKNLFRTVPGLL